MKLGACALLALLVLGAAVARAAETTLVVGDQQPAPGAKGLLGVRRMLRYGRHGHWGGGGRSYYGSGAYHPQASWLYWYTRTALAPTIPSNRRMDTSNERRFEMATH